jgi:hypothetical protein
VSTLQELADLGQKVANINAKMSVFETLALNQPKLVQEVTSLKSDIATLNRAIENVVHTISKRTSDLGQMDNVMMTRIMGMEQSFASMSKMFSAVVSELSDNKLLDQKSVLTRCRKSDEANDQERVQQMLQLKVIESADKVEIGEKGSLIVISQTFTHKTGEVETVADYRALDLVNPELDPKIKESYADKSAGDVVELNLQDGVLQTTIKQIFKYVEVYAQGEAEQANSSEQAGAEATNS